jgi:hypothetical protein
MRGSLSLLMLVLLGAGCAGNGRGPKAGETETGGAGEEETGGSGGKGTGGSKATGGRTGGSGGSTGGSGGGETGGTGGGSTGDAAAAPDAEVPPGDASTSPGPDATASGEGFMGLPPPPPGMTKIFNGMNLDGWECLPAAFGVKDGAMWAHYSGEDLCRTKQDYSYFRVVFNEHGGMSDNHMGFGFWGDHGPRYGNALVVIPPSGAIWDYVKPERMVTNGVGSGNNPIKHTWHQVEVIANRMTGEVLTAVNGKQVSAIKDTRLNMRKHGPIGFQDHGGASNHFYRDIYIEDQPKEFKLLTLKP